MLGSLGDTRMRDKQKDEECIKAYENLLPRISDYIDLHAREKPDEIAIIEHDTGEKVTWKEFSRNTKAFAAKLIDMGLEKGDVVATTLPLLKEHVYLMHACYRIGIIISPLDLRLKFREVDRCFEKINPRAYFFLGKTDMMDFRPMVAQL
ncbi:AMP-binding protein, partial [Candidatus Bathyarchaeota archaeon]|nr:AMP-binding protein [Candidatus Bathyarchaeota archaeon]